MPQQIFKCTFSEQKAKGATADWDLGRSNLVLSHECRLEVTVISSQYGVLWHLRCFFRGMFFCLFGFFLKQIIFLVELCQVHMKNAKRLSFVCLVFNDKSWVWNPIQKV